MIGDESALLAAMQAILDKIEAFQRAGGKVVAVGDGPIKSVDSRSWPGAARVTRGPLQHLVTL